MAVILMPISPTLPFFGIALTAALRAIATGRYLHEPYFAAKKLTDEETWRFVEERRWGYRGEFSRSTSDCADDAVQLSALQRLWSSRSPYLGSHSQSRIV